MKKKLRDIIIALSLMLIISLVLLKIGWLTNYQDIVLLMLITVGVIIASLVFEKIKEKIYTWTKHR